MTIFSEAWAAIGACGRTPHRNFQLYTDMQSESGPEIVCFAFVFPMFVVLSKCESRPNVLIASLKGVIPPNGEKVFLEVSMRTWIFFAIVS